MNESLRKIVHLLLGVPLAEMLVLHGRNTALPILVVLLCFEFALSDALQRGYRIAESSST